ncbi:mRNA triphosphatase CET1 [Wilcoxina mikolae CBS 423.85]|nr:mRNA triphosphatase CET1 [Wilcoxina mikolae CBS 423.85]
MASRRPPPSAHPPPQTSQHQTGSHTSAPPPHAAAQQQQQLQHHPRPPLPAGPLPLIASGQKILPGFGPWEPTIVNSEPYEEVSRQVADFLYHNVVMQNDPALVNGGPDGPIIEIEAKIGHLVDKNTNDRLKLPVRTETVFDHNDPSWRVQFRSSMTDMQHKFINNYLNKVVIESKRKESPEASRIPLDYVHTREQDSFYELPSDKYHILPPTIRETLNPRHQTRVRVTTDQKTGKVLKKIIKARIADMNVYSPLTAFDWRVSVNMEMPYTGDHEKLYPLGGGTGPGDGDRNKDRLSYRHLIYQVDLTQVTDVSFSEHELEVEVDGQEIRKHGLMARDKKPNSYEQLVKGFVDNVRVLIRAISPER